MLSDAAEDMVVFEEWMKCCEVTYETQDEKLKRFEIFKVNVRETVEGFPHIKEGPLWLHLSKFADLTDEEFIQGYTGCEPESEDEDEKNGVCAWFVDEKYMTELVEGMVFEDSEEEGAFGVKRKGHCRCDEKYTKELDAPEDGSVTVKRQRPCSCITSPAADDEKEDVTVPVKPQPER